MNGSSERLAVDVKKVRLSYGRGKNVKHILSNISLSVPEASIYGLLGPSGCGKTTLLRCVVGRLKPKNGSIKIFGFKPGEPGSQIPGPGIGYMPQEIAVYEDFTIKETLTYFGRLFLLDRRTLHERIEFLLAFLDLPHASRLVANLSGGQKRRVSLAAALVHSPPLLILDEPTVGVDPLLRQNIWQHLVTLTQTERISVIITTHYIEEARQANYVGLMRQGRMLAENTPARLLTLYNMDTLEDVFLKLCIDDSSARAQVAAGGGGGGIIGGGDDGNESYAVTGGTSMTNLSVAPISAAPTPDVNSNRKYPDIQETKMFNEKGFTNPTFVHSQADLTSVVTTGNNGTGTTGTPEKSNNNNMLSIVSSGGGMGGGIGGTQLSPAVARSLDYRYEAKKRTFGEYWGTTMALFWKNITRLRRNIPVLLFQFALPAIQVVLFCICIGADPFNIPLAVVNQDDGTLGNSFLSKLDNHVVSRSNFTDLEDAKNAVRNGSMWGVLEIPKGFSINLVRRMFKGKDIDNETIEQSTIRVYPDLTNQQISYTMERAFKDAFQAFARYQLQIANKNPDLAEFPLALGEPVYGELKHQGYLEYMAPGVVISISYIMATGLTALAFILERRDGLFERSLVAGVDTLQILVAHALCQIIVMAVQILLVLVFTFMVFDIPSRGPFEWVILLLLLQGCTGMAFGLVVSAICHQENTAVMMILGTFYPNLILSGIIWPLEAMPYWIRWFSYIQPQTLPTEALRHVLSRGWGILEPGVYIGFLVTIGWMSAFLVAAAVIFKYNK